MKSPQPGEKHPRRRPGAGQSLLLLFVIASVIVIQHEAFSSASVDEGSLGAELALPAFGLTPGLGANLTLHDLDRVRVELGDAADEEKPLAFVETEDAPAAKPAARVRTLPKQGLRVKLARNESLWDLSRRYNIRLDDIIEANAIKDPSSLRQGHTLFLPGAKKLAVRSRGGSYSGALPVAGRISSPFGLRRHPISGRRHFHRGVDIAARSGSSIVAVRSGVVTYSGYRGGYGYMVEIRSKDGVTTRYAHNLKNKVSVGTRVKGGQVIGRVGSTGYSTGPHVHYEILRNGRHVNPLKKS